MFFQSMEMVVRRASCGSGCGPNLGVLKAWICFFGLGSWMYHEIAAKAFTSILTFSVFAQALSFAVLVMQITASKSVAGISGRAMVMHAVKIALRLTVTVCFNGYLPTDNSGDWIYQVGDIVSLLLVCQILYYVYIRHKATYQREHDAVDVTFLVMAAFLLGSLVHPSLLPKAALNTVWMAHLWIDAVALVPQLWMISKADGKVHGLTLHYIAATLLSKVLSWTFWYFAYAELAEDGAKQSINWPGMAVMAAHGLHVVLLLDFTYCYTKLCLAGRLGSAALQAATVEMATIEI